MREAGTIERQSASYRQGLVLGLTMAEIMLLLVFCLLIAAGATLKHERSVRDTAERELAVLKDSAWNGRAERERVEKELSTLKSKLDLEFSARSKAEAEAAILREGLARERLAREKAEDEAAVLKDASPVAEMVVEAVMRDAQVADALKEPGAVSEAVISDFWEELTASRDAVRALEKRGMTAEELKENAEFVAEANELRKEGTSAGELRKQAEAADALKTLKSHGVSIEAVKENVKFLADAGALKQQAELAEGVREVYAANGAETREIDLTETLKALDKGIKAVKAEANGTKGDDPNGHKWPPMISLSEAGGYYFKLGSAELSPEFESRLHDVVIPILLKAAKDYDVNVIEVVGHTDELPIGTKSSNLDRDMIEVMRGDKPIGTLRPGDNAGLGIARSVSVVRSLLKDSRLEGMRVLPMSGAQLIKTDETLADGSEQGDVKERRRIEIRLRKSS